MAVENGYNESSVVLPSLFGDPGSAMENALNRKQQDKRFQYQMQRENDNDEWKKLNLIQGLTDLTQHQTGSDVANALGNRQASSILQKYTAAAKKMSPSELLANVQKDMQATINGMDGMKNELAMSDKQLMALKTQFPELDIAALAKDHRADIINRRLKGDEGFANPLEVPQSQFDMTNPDFLSRYITGNKNLSDAIINPKGAEDTSVLTGTTDSNTKWAAKQPFWKKQNFQQEAMKQGFLGKDFIPNLELKSSTIPSDAIPSSSTKPFEVIDKEVLDRFSQDDKLNMELIAATRHKFPTYDNFNQTEKEYAKRNVLHEQIKTLDQSNFHPVANTKPARTNIHIGGSGSSGESAVNDIYKRMRTEVKRLKDYGEAKVNIALLDADGQKIALDFARDATKDPDLTNNDVKVELSEKGEMNLWGKDGRLIGTLPEIGVNIGKQPNTKAKVEVVENANSKKQSQKYPLPSGKPKTVKQNGYTYTWNESTGKYE